MLGLDRVCAAYDGKEVLHQVSLQIESGKITVLSGPNGCGKSTLLKVMTGMIPRTGGDIQIAGRSIDCLKQGELAQQIAYLPQSRNVPEISVLRMVLHGRFPYLKYPRRYSSRDVEIARAALLQVGMEAFEEKSVSQLSGGMQQKVYIAMALAQDTPVIVMDEPTSFLDISYQMRLMEIGRELADQGKAVVMVLHDISMALRIADQAAVLSDGRIVMADSPERVFQSGVLDQIFDLQVKRIETEDGWRYYY